MTTNPTQFRKPAEKEPAWVTDLAAVGSAAENVGIFCKDNAELERLFEGEVSHCELCGAPFPVWPPREWAQHSMDAHAGAYTVQHVASMAQLLQSTLGPMHITYFHSQLLMRVSVRRRAWLLGFTQRVDTTSPDAGGGSRIVGPGGERLQ